MKRLAVLLWLCVLVLWAEATEPLGLRQAIAAHGEQQADVSRRLYGAKIPPTDPQSYEFESALVDLDGDGILDAVVLFSGAGDCGSGGCSLEIYRGANHGFHFVSHSTVSREPIRLLDEKSFGWHSLTVSVGGGGAKACDAALMRFNGRKYPGNPSSMPCATAAQLKSAKPLMMEK